MLEQNKHIDELLLQTLNNCHSVSWLLYPISFKIFLFTHEDVETSPLQVKGCNILAYSGIYGHMGGIIFLPHLMFWDLR